MTTFRSTRPKAPPKARSTTRRWIATTTACLMAAGVFAGTAPGASANDDDEAFDTKILRNVLRSLGLRDGSEPGIDYRERSPLVVPPTRDLPPPETASTTAGNPAWPTDVDVQRAREARAERRKPARSVEEESLPELPQQLDRAGRASRTPAGQVPVAGGSGDPTRPLTNAELGSRSLFSRVGGFFGQQREEYATFSGEPQRQSLTQPPPGYLTPSADQPYGVGRDRARPKAINPLDTDAMRGVQ